MSLSDYNSSRKPRILITNDDGIGAKGLRSLVDYVSDLGDIRAVSYTHLTLPTNSRV